MTANVSPFTAAGRLLNALDAPVFALAYGSHASARTGGASDLDLLYVTEAALPHPMFTSLIGKVEALHHEHGLTVDTEVAYAVKLHATRAEMIDALGLSGFRTADGLAAPPVPTDPVYLNSPVFKARLLLNAVSSPHVFLAGDPVRYRACRTAAERALLLLAITLTPSTDERAVESLAAALVTDPLTGSSGEDFLGYTTPDIPWLCHLLSLTIAASNTDTRPPKELAPLGVDLKRQLTASVLNRPAKF
ncbi:hypothetical protein [Cryptosporangium sp. NPDC048952]|uniref:hypothetical protein n=1 Tax=Cryptosporangium sp. NPDC048952 TaxID=3363961 RepID=UPI003710650E